MRMAPGRGHLCHIDTFLVAAWREFANPNMSLTIPNLVSQRPFCYLNFISVAKLQKFGNETCDAHVLASSKTYRKQNKPKKWISPFFNLVSPSFLQPPFLLAPVTVPSQQTHNVVTTSLQHRCNIVTLQRHCNNVDAMLNVHF